MKLNHFTSAFRRSCGRVAIGVGAFAAASSIPLLLSPTADADAIADVLAAAQVPLDTAQTLIAATTSPPISNFDMQVLGVDSLFLSQQESILTQLQTVQESLLHASPTDLADLDKLLISANEHVLNATASFIDTAENSSTIVQFFSGLDLINADFALISTDFEVGFGSSIAEFFGALGIPDIFTI